MPTVQALNSSNVPVTGLTPTWLYYGNVSGTFYGTNRRPAWKEISQGSYAFAPWALDKTTGAAWAVDLGAGVTRRYRCGFVGDGYKAFLRIIGGVPSGTVAPASMATYFQDGVSALPVASGIALVGTLAGFFLQPEPVIGVGALQRRPWTQKGALSLVDFGSGCDAEYRYQAAHWGDGTAVAIDVSQFDVLALWPATLPQEPFGESNGHYSSADNTITTENDTGPSQKRRRFTGKKEKFECTLTLDPTQMATLQNFYRVTLAEVRKFTWIDFRTLLPANYRFVVPPDATYWASEQAQGAEPIKHWWTVAIQLELLD